MTAAAWPLLSGWIAVLGADLEAAAPAEKVDSVRHAAALFLAILLTFIVLVTISVLLLRAHRRRQNEPTEADTAKLADPWRESANRVQPFKQE